MKKKILVLGGTGAMGVPLVQMISRANIVYVTSRSSHPSTESILYIKGNARDEAFLREVTERCHYDAIIDFMVWGGEFCKVLPILLDNTDQYVFISSARVYAQSEAPITEDTPRLLDVSEDKVFLATNEYALAKARDEDLLKNSGRTNYTIIRPSITYNAYRLQLGVLEKESWLYRVLRGHSIVFSRDIADKRTTMTLGDDVAAGIASIVGEKSALGEAFHITYPASLLWSEVLDVYVEVLERRLKRKINVVMTEKSKSLLFPRHIYQIIYCRYFNRTFDNSKIGHYCNPAMFTPPRVGLAECLEHFLDNPSFSQINWGLEACMDEAANEWTPLSEIPQISGKLDYIIYRYHLLWAKGVLFKGLGMLRRIKKFIHS